MTQRELRCRVLRFRVTDAEMERLSERAHDCGLTLSAFVRQVSLGAVPRTRPHAVQRDAIYQLARVGSNLNQLARHANATHRVELSRRLAEVLAEVKQAIERLA